MDHAPAPLQWSEPDPYGGLRAEAPEGQWSISLGSGEARIRFHPNLPGLTQLVRGMDEEQKAIWRREWDMLQNHPGKADHTEAYQKLSHAFGIGNDDAMYAETLLEAHMLVDAMRGGDAVLPRAEEQLQEAGFTIKHPGSPTLRGLWSKQIRSGSYDVSLNDDAGSRSARITYHGDGARRWHNVAGVTQRMQGQGAVIHHSFPNQVRDPLRIAVAHALRVMELRTERGGRFSKPLGEIVRRPR